MSRQVLPTAPSPTTTHFIVRSLFIPPSLASVKLKLTESPQPEMLRWHTAPLHDNRPDKTHSWTKCHMKTYHSNSPNTKLSKGTQSCNKTHLPQGVLASLLLVWLFRKSQISMTLHPMSHLYIMLVTHRVNTYCWETDDYAWFSYCRTRQGIILQILVYSCTEGLKIIYFLFAYHNYVV